MLESKNKLLSSNILNANNHLNVNSINPSYNVNNNSNNVVYGELVILGYNGSLPQGDKGRRKSKFTLFKRPEPNGIRKNKHYVVQKPQMTRAIQDKGQHSISYTLSRNQAVIVEYTSDNDTDMFQIGRSSESPIDFIVIDTPSSDKLNATADPSKQNDQVTQQSTISRFACRILVDRKPPYTASIYAAGFDSSKNIFLGEKATKWQQNGEIDGLTTNGVLISHPKIPFYLKSKNDDSVNKRLNLDKYCKQSEGWREVSVCGSVYAIRETRSASTKGEKIDNETNILQDGTLIDLCGATLIWRSAEGLKHSPTKRVLEDMIDQMNAARPLCPVGLNTLIIPRRSYSNSNSEANRDPYVYLVCGHVQGLHHWGIQKSNSNARKCPVCLRLGPAVRLLSGIESSFYVDKSSLNFAFNPCGHMASERTVKTWASISIPHGINGFRAICPFCADALDEDNPYVKLIFQDQID